MQLLHKQLIRIVLACFISHFENLHIKMFINVDMMWIANIGTSFYKTNKL